MSHASFPPLGAAGPAEILRGYPLEAVARALGYRRDPADRARWRQAGSVLSLHLIPVKHSRCAVVSTGAVTDTIPKWIETWNPRQIFCAWDATQNGDHAARRLIRKDTRSVRMRPPLDDQDWNDLLRRDRDGEPLETDDRPIK